MGGGGDVALSESTVRSDLNVPNYRTEATSYRTHDRYLLTGPHDNCDLIIHGNKWTGSLRMWQPASILTGRTLRTEAGLILGRSVDMSYEGSSVSTSVVCFVVCFCCFCQSVNQSVSQSVSQSRNSLFLQRKMWVPHIMNKDS